MDDFRRAAVTQPLNSRMTHLAQNRAGSSPSDERAAAPSISPHSQVTRRSASWETQVRSRLPFCEHLNWGGRPCAPSSSA
jgi:hypothetical protein